MDDPKKYFEFDPKKLQEVNINDVRPNSWNPKDPDDPDYEKVKESVLINGLTQPIFVRENSDGITKYEILDGEHRHRAAMDLGYEKIYIYNEGKVPDEYAKTLTIWHEVGVKMKDELVAPLALELKKLNFDLPFSDKEIKGFEKLASFEFTDFSENDKTTDDDFKMETLTVKMTPEQYEIVQSAIDTIMNGENVSAGRALELLCSSGLSGYPFDGYGSSNS